MRELEGEFINVLKFEVEEVVFPVKLAHDIDHS
jgi:hypothetical protein